MIRRTEAHPAFGLPLDRRVLLREERIGPVTVSLLQTGLPEDRRAEPVFSVFERDERADRPTPFVADAET